MDNIQNMGFVLQELSIMGRLYRLIDLKTKNNHEKLTTKIIVIIHDISKPS